MDEAAAYVGADYRIGERGSTKLRDFDFGNSPTQVRAADLKPDATVVLTTTNGTPAEKAQESEGRVAVVGCGWGEPGHRGRVGVRSGPPPPPREGLRARRAGRARGRYLEQPKEALRRNTAARRPVSSTSRTSISASPRTPCWSCPASWETLSSRNLPGTGGRLARRPKRGR